MLVLGIQKTERFFLNFLREGAPLPDQTGPSSGPSPTLVRDHYIHADRDLEQRDSKWYWGVILISKSRHGVIL